MGNFKNNRSLCRGDIKFVIQLMNHESPVINGDDTYSRDFTYIDNVIQMNLLAITTKNKEAVNEVYNTAVGDSTNLLELTQLVKKHLANYDKKNCRNGN